MFKKSGFLNFILLLTLYYSNVSADVTTFNYYGTPNGLSNLSVTAISQDHTGYIWVGTIKGLFKFDGHQFEKITSNQKTNDINVTSLFSDNQGRLWVGSKKNGLLMLSNGQWQSIDHDSNDSDGKGFFVKSIHQTDQGKIWISTNKGLGYYSPIRQTIVIPGFLKNLNISALTSFSSDQLLLGSKGSLSFFNTETQEIKSFVLEQHKKAHVHDLLIHEKKIWLATSDGIITFDPQNNFFDDSFDKVPKIRILNLIKYDNQIWIATVDQGLYLINESNQISNFTATEYQASLSDNYIRTLYVSPQGHLWVGNFYNGINHLDIKTLAFHYETKEKNSLYCSDSPVIGAITEKSTDTLWLSSTDGLIEFNPQSGACELITHNKEFIVYSIAKNKGKTWLSTSDGLKLYDEKNNKISDTGQKGVTYFTFENNEGKFYIATTLGLFEYDSEHDFAKLINNSENIEINSYQTDSHHNHYFLTNNGLTYLKNNELKPFPFADSKYLSSKFTAFYMTQDNHFYISSGNGLMYFNNQGILLENYALQNDNIELLSINNIIPSDNRKALWLTSDNRLIHFDLIQNKSTIIKNITGSDINTFMPDASYVSSTGKLYFGTTKGFIYFDPMDIDLDEAPDSVVISSMKLLNKEVVIDKEYDSGFKLKKLINKTPEITIGHQDYIIGFEFTSLSYTNNQNQRFAYRLTGFNDDWVESDLKHRQVTYTNLSPKHYTFEIKTTNDSGIWSPIKQLKITVLPAPWLTWWAFTSYALAFFGLLSLYWHKKNRDNIRITKILKAQVQQRTQELQLQKHTVENLLAKKNEMFANVSHEFRTPLTLILGPINKLLNEHLHSDHLQTLRMVNRNANRLLTMIEQLLLLAKLTGEEKIAQVPQLINHQILSIVEIFSTLATEKRITLTLLNNNKAAINATPHTIDTVLGNLLSNAIKYTPIGGEVTVNSYTKDGFIYIEVTDTGCGLDKEQQHEIFNRFKRLDTHANIEGVGIGLSIVEEVLKINNGELSIASEVNKGSEFTVKFATVDATEIDQSNEKLILTNQLAKNALLETSNKKVSLTSTGHKSNDTVLIIEDNDDMREHISDALKSQFHCLLADRGKEGIALAIKHIPDIIVCDVMMPEMDGFKVSNILRSDTRTSHIPLILLTALHDKASRIKGWREHVDAYLTKPFDVDELLLQLNNVLVIRNILKKKTGNMIVAGKKTSANIDLPKMDKAFIDKLNDLVANNYNNPTYQRNQLSSDMAVSERQLQRKTKALIDKNPMELLREYRLKKAADKLKEGFQVSIICDECGFNSLSYFSLCFKAHYGVSPKVYQQTCNEKAQS